MGGRAKSGEWSSTARLSSAAAAAATLLALLALTLPGAAAFKPADFKTCATSRYKS
jgi:hypothetical protein